MATKMYKGQNSRWVRGFEAKACLDDGWTFDVPSKTASLKPKVKSRYRLTAKDVEIKQTNLHSPEDSNLGD
jgi:hypothetical protein